jgi:hypothetical protein
MPARRSVSLALGAICIALATFACSAWAGEPATVTVRVEGFNGVTLLPQTQVTTSTTPIPVEGGSCSGTSAGGALYDATHGDWQVKDEAEGVGIFGIEGVDLPPFGAGDYAFWSVWVNSKFATSGACGEELGPNARVVFAGQCFALGPECPTSETAPDHFLTSTAPTSSVAGVGEPVSVTIGSLSTASGAAEAALPGSVTVTGGSLTVSPNAEGVATLSFSAAGTYTIQAHAPDAVPSDPYTVCVHDGNDGNCGTTAPATSTSTSTNAGASPTGSGGVAGFLKTSYTGPYALVARATDLSEGHTYGPANAPRVLSGTVLAHSAVSSISLKLRRRYKGRCSAYNGTRERFVPARCGEGSYFKVSSSASYSYLLPAALAPGRYVLDILATDAAGDHTTLARGSSRIVFYVRQ